MQKICAGIVTYNPDIELLKKNIDSIIKQVDKVFIIDNGSDNLEKWKLQISNLNIAVIENKNNLGIAKALNLLCKIAIKNHFECILTLDQDSISPKALVEDLQKYMDVDVAVVSPDIIYKNNESYISTVSNGIKQVEWVITSASLTNLNIWGKLGGFDENLFIDGVDRDYGIRANNSGYKVLKCYDVKLMHELGKLECRKKFGRVIYVTNHSAIRKYYMTRNAIYLDKKLGLNDSFKYVLKLAIKTIIYEDKKSEKLKAIIVGIRDSKKLIEVLDK